VYVRYALTSMDLFAHGMFTNDRFEQTVRGALPQQHRLPADTRDDTPIEKDPS